MKRANNALRLAASIAIPLIAGAASSLLTGRAMERYDSFTEPPLSPPGIVFPIVWTVLYILMGISFYLVAEDKSAQTVKPVAVYFLQLIVNIIWPLLFFNKEAYLASFLWLVLLWLLVFCMIKLFYPISKAAAWLNVPYLIWLTFAGYLNLGVYLLNR
ncbi:MAG: tryptophan-rich sensory protein [Clostridia bacterium]|nr:tryptophan-rich sensory protein [Clostridia bacterium]